MRWSLLSEGMFQLYHLTDNEKTVSTLKYNSSTGSVRLEYGEKRLFFIRQQRSVQSKYAITNEYGYSIASFKFLDLHTGTLLLEKKIYLFLISQEEITMYNDRNELIIQFDNVVFQNAMQSAAMIFSATWVVTESYKTAKTTLAGAF